MRLDYNLTCHHVDGDKKPVLSLNVPAHKRPDCYFRARELVKVVAAIGYTKCFLHEGTDSEGSRLIMTYHSTPSEVDIHEKSYDSTTQ